jgi:hypothetical protein
MGAKWADTEHCLSQMTSQLQHMAPWDWLGPFLGLDYSSALSPGQSCLSIPLQRLSLKLFYIQTSTLVCWEEPVLQQQSPKEVSVSACLGCDDRRSQTRRLKYNRNLLLTVWRLGKLRSRPQQILNLVRVLCQGYTQLSSLCPHMTEVKGV